MSALSTCQQKALRNCSELLVYTDNSYVQKSNGLPPSTEGELVDFSVEEEGNYYSRVRGESMGAGGGEYCGITILPKA